MSVKVITQYEQSDTKILLLITLLNTPFLSSLPSSFLPFFLSVCPIIFISIYIQTCPTINPLNISTLTCSYVILMLHFTL